jgi:hypothetical protein
MPAIIHLQYLPDEADVIDIRQFFHPLQIRKGYPTKITKNPIIDCSLFSGDVHIVRREHEHDDAYITFHTIDDARRAIQKNGDLICQYPVTLSIYSHIEEQVAQQGKILEFFLFLE